MLPVWVILLGCFVSLLTIWYRNRKEKFKFFKKRGIPGPEPSFWFGNIDDLHKDSQEAMRRWCQTYGKNRMFGIFNGESPVLVSTDLKFANKVLIKDFQNFVDRGDIQVVERVHPLTATMLVVLRQSEWKITRNYMTPIFSTSKLKANVPMVEKGCQDLLKYLEEREGEDIEMMEVWRRLTADNISRIAFGVEADSVLTGKSSKAVEYAIIAVKQGGVDLVTKLTTSFQFLITILGVFAKIFFKLKLFPHSLELFESEVSKIVKFRQSSKVERNDLISLLMKAEAYHTNNYNDFTISDNDDSNSQAKINGARIPPMSSDAVSTNATLFMIAGFETTSTALSFLTGRLANNPDIQERLRQEIRKAISENNGKIDYEVATSIKYLSQCIDEALRMDPPVMLFTSRKALVDFEWNGIHFPKGTSILFPCREIQRDPEYFPNPDKYDPDRFSPQRKSEIPSMAFQPFGDGPRNCIGMRIALTQIKFAMCHLLTRYRLKTDIPLEATKSGLLLSTPKALRIRFEAI